MTVTRPETPDDAAAIDAILSACFPTPLEAALVRALRAGGRLVASVVAAEGQVVVGHAAFSPVTPKQGPAGVGLAPLAVAPMHRRQGVGAALVAAGLDACRAAGCGWAVVLGDPSYYARFGFRPASGFGLRDAYGGGDAFQALELLAGALPRGAGLVRYAPEFAAFEGGDGAPVGQGDA